MHIKKLILLLFLVPVLAQAQKTTGANYTYIAQRYEWLAGVFKALGIPAGDSAQFQTGQEMRAGAIYYDSVGVDSGLYVWSGLAWNAAGTSYTDADARAAISLTTTGTSGAATYSSATGVFNIPVYAGTLNTNAGAFYRWLKPGTQEIKTFAPGYGFLLDSATNADAITAILDSATVFPDIRASIAYPNLRVERAGAGIPIWYLRASDTTLMLKDVIGETFISVGTKTDSTIYVRLDTADTDLHDFIALYGGGGGGPVDLTTDVTGILPIANGGTGSATKNFVDLTTAQSIAGNKSFTSNVLMSNVIQTNTTIGNSNWFIAGSTGIGTALTTAQLLPPGSTNMRYRMGMRGSTSTTLTAGDTYVSFPIGEHGYAEPGSGTIPYAGQMHIRALAGTDAGGTTTDAATFSIEGALTGITPTGYNDAFRVWKNASRFGGRVLLDTGSTAAGTAPLYFPQGTNMTTPEDGAMEYNGTHLYFSIGSTRYQIDQQAKPTLTRHANISNPISTDDLFVFSTDIAITITSVKAVLVGSSTPSVTYNIVFDADRSAVGTNVYTAGQTVTSTTTMTAASGVNDATIPAGSVIRVKLSAQSGTVGELDISITYTED